MSDSDLALVTARPGIRNATRRSPPASAAGTASTSAMATSKSKNHHHGISDTLPASRRRLKS
ncbi:hypothetical protein ACEPPN_018914 [Leptodophora sp. 'Broadleaf-Isolate-01']